MKSGFARVMVTASLLAMALGAFGTQGATGASVATVGGCRPNGHVVCVDRADGGHTVHVRVGQVLKVGLGSSGLTWSGLRELGPDLLRPNGPADHRAGGLTASYTAVKVGRTALRASGAPKCSRGKACPQFILLWQVRVVVS